MIRQIPIALFALLALAMLGAYAPVAHAADLVVAANGRTEAIVVSAAEGDDKAAADDLVHYIELMTGATPKLATTAAEITAAKRSQSPVFFVGAEALKTDPSLQQALDGVKKKDPFLYSDAIAVRRKGNHVYLAGINGQSTYFAVSWLLQEWGCRWYFPTEFGECIPTHQTLALGEVDHAYAPPFEIRGYWIAWVGDGTGRPEFSKRNFMNNKTVAGMGHALAKYTGDNPFDVSHWNVPFADPKTAEHVYNKIKPQVDANESSISLAIEDGAYENDGEADNRLIAGVYDKYFLKPSLTDPMMAFYRNVGNLIKERSPNSDTLIGGMAYVNVTIPPQWKIDVPDNVVMWLAPIDIDPIHGMDDEKSPPRQEYREMMYRWSEIMDGRLVIYDYDQGMLVWRDIPNPSHMAFRHDVKHYRDAGILGISTESRNAIATVGLNLFFRGQLMWNPDADVDALLEEFYPKFFGPTAEPMRAYWTAIYDAWENTVATEHEFFIAPAIYTPELMAHLREQMAEAEKLIKPLEAKAAAQRTRHEQQYVDRMEYMRLTFGILDGYMTMVFKAATDLDYAEAARAGAAALALRDKLTDVSGIFTTYRGYNVEGQNYPWFPGEVRLYRELAELTDGTKGKLITKLPLEWSFRRDPRDTGLARGFGYQKADLTYWNARKSEYDTPETRKDYPTTEWEVVRTDVYTQPQGILHPDWQTFTGYMWYKTEIDLKAGDVNGKPHIRFPGLFSECWLYVNGYLVAHRPQNHMWWYNNYSFQWDVDLSDKLKPGKNDITLRVHNTHHLGGMFRRPFLYEPTGE